MRFDAIVLIAFLIGLAAGGGFMDNHWQSKWDTAKKDAAEAQLKAIDTAVLQYRNRVTALELITRETENKLNTVAADADAANAAANGLRLTLSDYLRNRSKCTTSTPTTSERAAEATDELVLTELFGRMERRLTAVTEIADENRARGLGCEAAYNQLWTSSKVRL